jgi:hypothetical protein
VVLAAAGWWGLAYALRISDDGAGFLPGLGPAKPDPDHLGLVSMREQAVMAGGWCRVSSAPAWAPPWSCGCRRILPAYP